ncbi:carbonic anhydrase 2-like isoform X2 [Armigeres subalbatus]
MKIAKLQQQLLLLNTLVFLPWMSCQRLDTHQRPSRSNEFTTTRPRRAISYRNDNDRRLGLFGDYDSEEVNYNPSPSRARFGLNANPDFYFDYARDLPTTTRRSQSLSLVRERPRNNEAAGGAEFSYREKDKYGPANWDQIAPQCGGKYQSPILLNTSSALYVRNKRPLQLVGQTNLPQSIRLQNDGHSAKFTYVWRNGERPYLRGGPLKTKYYFEQFHFHWGSDSSSGSEHVLDFQRYPMELHLVFYNSLYSSFDDARSEVDGLVVMGLFYELYEINDEPLNTWTRFLQEIVVPDSEYPIQFIDTFPLYDLIGDVEWPYFSYEGSLTTPPCLETVTWIVSTKPLLITPREIQEFRKIRSKSGPMVNNFRPVQKLYNRRVYRY